MEITPQITQTSQLKLMDKHTLEKNIANKVRSEVYIVMTTFETILQDAVLTAIENLVIPRVELAMKSSARGVDTVVLDPDQRKFSKSIQSLQMTASSIINSHLDLNRIDEYRGSITVEGGDLTVNERNCDQQAHTHNS